MGALEPERFLAVAEEAGLLSVLTEQLLRKACAAAAEWPATVRLSFNLPGALLLDPVFGLRVIAVLADTHLAPSRLNLEIDEGALIRDSEAAQALIEPLRRAGVCIVADNFGTGYADLQSLHRLQLDGIKIDRSFIGAMLHDRQAAVMVKALIGIGQGLDLTVVADGVVTEEQKTALAAWRRAAPKPRERALRRGAFSRSSPRARGAPPAGGAAGVELARCETRLGFDSRLGEWCSCHRSTCSPPSRLRH